LDFKKIIEQDSNLTFLVGAGCSIDPPSCQPSGSSMMEAIIKFTCPKQEVDSLISLEKLRFEGLIEIFRDTLDPDLKIIDYYGVCNKPNIQHFYIASMIKSKQYVLTTNFDFLIEYAMVELGIPKDRIKPIITRRDFQKNSDPDKIFDQNYWPLYKVHGSTKNIITGEDTRDSLVATLQAFGANKKGLNIFQIEPFKKPLFDKISVNRSLIIIGYSGSDDFDIVPTLYALENLKNVYWIYFVPEDGGSEEVIEVLSDIEISSVDEKTLQILKNLRTNVNVDHVYLVKTNTSRLIEDLINIDMNIKRTSFSLDPLIWLTESFNMPKLHLKYYIASNIYFDFGVYEDSLRCAQTGLKIVNKEDDLYWQSRLLERIGHINRVQGEYSQAVKNFKKALKISKKLENREGISQNLTNIGKMYEIQSKYIDALKTHEKALKIAENLEDELLLAQNTGNLGRVYYALGNFSEALKYYELSLRFNEQLGNLIDKAARLNNMAKVYRKQNKLEKSLVFLEEALSIAEQIGKKSAKATYLINIGRINEKWGKMREALDHYQKAYKIDSNIGKLSAISRDLDCIAGIYVFNEKYDAAEKHIKESIKLNDKIGRYAENITRLNKLGDIYTNLSKYSKGLKRYRNALKIANETGKLRKSATILSKMGNNLQLQGKNLKALEKYEESFKVYLNLNEANSQETLLLKDKIYKLKHKINQ